MAMASAQASPASCLAIDPNVRIAFYAGIGNRVSSE